MLWYNFECANCHNKTFTGTACHNDEAMNDTPDDWKLNIVFKCHSCSAEITRIVETVGGKMTLSTAFRAVDP